MNIMQLVKDSLHLSWHQKRLWLFGFFVAAGSGSGGGHSSSANAAELPPETLASLPIWLPWLVGLGALLGLVVLVLHVISEGALIFGATEAHRGRPATNGLAFRAGLQTFWPVLGVKLTMLGVALLSMALVAVPGLLGLFQLLSPAVALALTVPALLVAVPWLITVYLVYALALRFVVLDNRHALDAIVHARRFLHQRLFDTLMLLLAVGVSQVGATVLALLLLIPIGLLAAAAYLTGGLVPAVIVGAASGIPLLTTLVAFLGTFQSTLWTLGYTAAQSIEP